VAVSGTCSHELGHTPGAIPIGDIDVGLLIYVASMRGTEECRRDLARLKLVVGPLRLLRVVAKESGPLGLSCLWQQADVADFRLQRS
jgi:hypothetical protein